VEGFAGPTIISKEVFTMRPIFSMVKG